MQRSSHKKKEKITVTDILEKLKQDPPKIFKLKNDKSPHRFKSRGETLSSHVNTIGTPSNNKNLLKDKHLDNNYILNKLNEMDNKYKNFNFNTIIPNDFNTKNELFRSSSSNKNKLDALLKEDLKGNNNKTENHYLTSINPNESGDALSDYNSKVYINEDQFYSKTIGGGGIITSILIFCRFKAFPQQRNQIQLSQLRNT